MAIPGEAGELADAIKKHIIYDKPLDVMNVIEELGDLMFFITALMNKMNLSMENVLQANVVKLNKRYPALQYSDSAAQARLDKVGEE
jgi:NTP pyrophosphatase (non-canonical NTP hydrolase)